MHTFNITVSALVISLVAGAAAYAADTRESTPAPAAAVAKGTDKDGNVKFENDAYITLSGTVGEITDEDAFTLNHAGGIIEVDTNAAWPDLFAGTGSMLKTGDRVSVTGKVDNNLFSANEIEAYRLSVAGESHSRVYTNSHYAPDYGDDFAAYENAAYGAGLDDDQKVRISGEVSRIMEDDTFMLRYGNGQIIVDAEDVEFTNAGRLAVGDEVVVFGKVDKALFQKKQVEAERVILSRAYSQIAR